MSRKIRFVPPLLLLIIFSFTACVSAPEKEAAAPAAPAASAPAVERRIEVIQEMRAQAVSRRVGRWAVVIGISDYRYDTSWNPQLGIPDPKNPQNLYLLCHDTQPDKFFGTGFPMWEIDVALNRTIRSKKVFVIADACHSAGVGGTRAVSVADQFNEYKEKLDG